MTNSAPSSSGRPPQARGLDPAQLLPARRRRTGVAGMHPRSEVCPEWKHMTLWHSLPTASVRKAPHRTVSLIRKSSAQAVRGIARPFLRQPVPAGGRRALRLRDWHPPQPVHRIPQGPGPPVLRDLQAGPLAKGRAAQLSMPKQDSPPLASGDEPVQALTGFSFLGHLLFIVGTGGSGRTSPSAAWRSAACSTRGTT